MKTKNVENKNCIIFIMFLLFSTKCHLNKFHKCVHGFEKYESWVWCQHNGLYFIVILRMEFKPLFKHSVFYLRHLSGNIVGARRCFAKIQLSGNRSTRSKQL